MLGSITPLGERGRGSRWWLTVSAYVTGSVIGGVVTGAVFGFALMPLATRISMGDRLAAVGVAVVLGQLVDLGSFGVRLPSVHRQVDETWRTRYRGWVWGLGYGVQLGVGLITVVTTSLVYVTWVAAALSGSAAAGAAIGAAFGLARALPVFSVAGVRRPDQLMKVDAVLRRLARPARGATIAAGAAVASVAFVGMARW